MTASPVMQLGALAGALAASDRRGLLAALNEQPAAADELARRLELEPAGTGLVLEVLRTNGLLVVVDMFGDGTEEGERLRSAYAVHLSLRVASGRPHPEPEVRDWLRRSGLGNCRHLDLPPLMGLAALVATADGSELPLLPAAPGAGRRGAGV